MRKLKMVCYLNKRKLKEIITLDNYRKGNVSRDEFWYLHGRLEEDCGFDKAKIYNLSDFPEYRKRTVMRYTIKSNGAAVIKGGKRRTVWDSYINGEVEVEVVDIEKPCIGIFWTTDEIMVQVGINRSITSWVQRGLVCYLDDTGALEYARKMREELAKFL